MPGVGELRVRASRVANARRGRRLEPGDRVAVLSRNVSELWELFLGCALSGTVPCPINFRLVGLHERGISPRT
jgi:crotonobetaine/carnitine-CoA ligase